MDGFNRRYGFRDEPDCIRFRILDPACSFVPGQGTPDVKLDGESFAGIGKIASRVFITENKTNFLAFPLVKNSIVIFGAGYGHQTLSMAKWLQECEIYYWGDLDTHGFAILDGLRAHFAHVESFLMDRETLMACAPSWVAEDDPTDRDLQRLTPPEAALYDDLRTNKICRNLRLEQEYIDFNRVTKALGLLPNEESN